MRKPVRAALFDLALQARVSLGGELDACKGEAPALSGRMPLRGALGRLLAESGCDYSLPNPDTVLIRAAPIRRPLPASTSSAKAAMIEAPVGEIVVTGLRNPDLPGRAPYAITALAGSDLVRDHATSLQDLTGDAAGLTVTNLGPGRDKVFLRGLSDGAFTGQAQSVVALYLDDLPLTYNAPDPDLRLADIDRVELMRGPQGTLYGGGSIGGVVRIATRKPDLDHASAAVTAGLSANSRGGTGDELEAVANMPIIPGRLALRAVAYRDSQPGYIRDTALGLSDINSARRDGARVSAKLDLSPGWSLLAGLTHQSINTADTQYGLRRLGGFTRQNLVREPHDNDFNQVSVTLSGDGQWGRLTASTARSAHDLDSRFDASGSLGPFAGPAGPAASDERRHIEFNVTEATYATPQRWRLRGLLGAFVSTGETLAETRIGTLDAPIPTYAESRTDKVEEAAIYGEATWDITPRLSATLGLRWFDFRYSTRSIVTQAAGLRRVARADDATGFSPKLLVSYRTDRGDLLYAQASEGYRPGGFNTSGRIGQAFDTPGAPRSRYGADELWNFELGAKVRLWDGRVQGRLAAFYAVWDAIQSDQYLAYGLGYTANVGAGDNRGLEVEAVWRLDPRWDLRGALLINDPQVLRADPNFSTRGDTALPGVASASGGLTVDYHRDLAHGRTLRLSGRATYVGSSRPTFDSDGAASMGGYGVLRAGVALEGEHWTLSGDLDNLLDTHANTFAFGNPFLLRREPVITPVQPRTLSIRLIRTF